MQGNEVDSPTAGEFRPACSRTEVTADLTLTMPGNLNAFRLSGSGSQGNSLVVEAGRTRLLLDCGFGLAETVNRLVAWG